MKNNTILGFNRSNKRMALVAAFSLLFSFGIKAQVFWTENFGVGTCGATQGQVASAYSGVNGAWTISFPTANDPQANEWFVSAAEAGMGVGVCGNGCGNNAALTNQTLHVGANDGLTTTDAGASYDAGGLCGLGVCVATDARAESPTINCTGHVGITLNFNYMMNGQAGFDFGTVEYSINNGATWLLLTNPAITPFGGCSPQGQWTAFTFALPATCDNNATVKIGFHWVNNDDGTGTDPSFALDDITLSTVSVNTITTGVINPTTYCACSTINVPFTSTGTFNAGNIYKAELSDAAGSFGAPVIIGIFASTANAGTIACTIPCNTPAGAGYMINVVSSNPLVTGVSNGPITINAADNASFSYNAPSYCQNGTTTPTITGFPTGTFSATPAGLVFVSTATGQVNLATSALGTYTITYLTSGPCPASSTNTITITAPPTANFSYAPTSFCSGGANPTPTIAAGSSAGTFSSTGGLVFVNAGTGQIDLTASTPGAYTITNTIAASGGCPAATATFNITITAAPSATISYPTSTFCQSGFSPNATITGTNGGTFSAAPAGLVWGSTLTGQINCGSSLVGTYTVTYTIPAGGGCPAFTTTFSVTITTAPSAAFSYNPTTFCQYGANPSPTFGVGASAGVFSAAPGGLVFVSTATGQIDLSLSAAGTYTVTNTIAASGSCPAASANFSITIVATSGATFSYTGSPYCQSGINPTPTIAPGSAAGTFTSTPGLSIVAATGAVNLSASTPGTYTVTNTVAGSVTCPSTTATATITISVSLIANFSYAGSPYCSNAGTASVTFAAGGSAGNFTATPAGLTLNAANGDVTLGTSTAGTYTVTNTIPASGSCPATSATATITITHAAVATFNYTPSTYCQSGANPSPTFTGGGVAGTFTAPAGLVFVSATTGQVNLSGSTPGTYTVTNTIPANGGCPAVVATSPITIITAPCATFGYANTPYCQSSANPSPTLGAGCALGTFTAAPAGLVFVSSTTGVVNLSGSTPGTYTVTNTIAASGGCPAATATSTIVINASPVVTVNSPTICHGSTATLTATGATSYTWSAGATPTGGGNATASPLLTTTYTVTGTTGTCTGTAVATVTVQVCNPPEANFGASPLVTCYSGSPVCVTYTDSSTNNPTSWQWSFPGGTPNSSTSQSPGPICYNALGQYTSELIVTNATGTDTMLRTNYVSLVAPIQPSITGNLMVNSCESTQLTAQPVGTSYQWGPSGECTDCQTVTVSPSQTTQYWLIYNDINGCTAYDTTTVEVTAIYTYFMPTGFSPNGDGINDQLVVYGRGIKYINLRIFDRIGEKVWETSTITKDPRGFDYSDGWDGRLHGVLMNENSFVYELQVTYCDDETVKENGSLTLVK